MSAFPVIILIAFCGVLWFCARSFFDWLEQRKERRYEKLLRSVSLTQCIKCGRRVSTVADRCPGCGYAGFRGVTCMFCQQQLDEQSAILIKAGGEDCAPLYAHPSCVEREFAIASPVRCRTCGEVLRNISALQFAKKEAVCSQCGSPFPLL